MDKDTILAVMQEMERQTGMVIDWSSDTVLPVVMDALSGLILYKTLGSLIFFGLSLLMLLLTVRVLHAKVLDKGQILAKIEEERKRDIYKDLSMSRKVCVSAAFYEAWVSIPYARPDELDLNDRGWFILISAWIFGAALAITGIAKLVSFVQWYFMPEIMVVRYLLGVIQQ